MNNGVYRAGFATSQDAYDEAVAELFESLDWLEDGLSRRRYLVGDRVTEADWRLFPTLLGSTRSITDISNATGGGSSITRSSGPMRGSSTNAGDGRDGESRA